MKSLLASLALIVMAHSAALAQSTEAFVEAFSGEWFAFDPDLQKGGQSCKLELDRKTNGDRFVATTQNCGELLDGVSGWGILDNQLGLFAGDGTPIAKLGGNQVRITGEATTGGAALILERAKGDGNNVKLATAIRRYGCFYEGYSSKCSEPADLGKPKAKSGEDSVAEVEVIVDLNVRNQPRRSASTIGAINRNTCIKVDQCLRASDGIWCRARFGDNSGWFVKTALRRNEWPILTYKNACKAGDS